MREEIIGGVESKPHSRPYMAHLEIIDRVTTSDCGGFLINEEFVMTAAHCKGGEIIVTLGAHDQDRTHTAEDKSRKANRSPQYNVYPHLHDIMLLKLQRKAKITSAVAKILLPSPRDSIKPGRLCLAAGWGKTGVKEPLSVKLREVTLRIMGKEACKIYSNYTDDFQVCVGRPGNIQSVFEVRTDIFSLPASGDSVSEGRSQNSLPHSGFSYCEGSVVGGKRSVLSLCLFCNLQGDSGGPLVCAGVAHGIVSYGRPDAKPPAVFTRTSGYVSWVNAVIKEHSLKALSA
ncbi:LOW QUALITY PROTEIN: hypothetical protein U0070_021835 [Myodes glareolus]|uniref:Peptidase S1 domain-containing protein n=1 Tax=Myodes glareolus TaxID=447135 RepID=A0AAW0GWX5_MYOGA